MNILNNFTAESFPDSENFFAGKLRINSLPRQAGNITKINWTERLRSISGRRECDPCRSPFSGPPDPSHLTPVIFPYLSFASQKRISHPPSREPISPRSVNFSQKLPSDSANCLPSQSVMRYRFISVNLSITADEKALSEIWSSAKHFDSRIPRFPNWVLMYTKLCRLRIPRICDTLPGFFCLTRGSGKFRVRFHKHFNRWFKSSHPPPSPNTSFMLTLPSITRFEHVTNSCNAAHLEQPLHFPTLGSQTKFYITR